MASAFRPLAGAALLLGWALLSCAGGAGAAPFYEIESQSKTQTSLLTTRYFDAARYRNTDYAGHFNGRSHVASPYNSAHDMRISLSRRSFTVELWVRHNRAREQSLPSYFVSQGSNQAGAGERLLIGFKADHTFECSFYDGQALVTHKAWHGDLGQWHHWAVTFDEDTMERVVYRDGVEVGRDLASTQLVADPGLRMGHAHLADANLDLFFEGDLDEVRLWETVLDIDTIRRYASLTSAWVTDFHPSVAHLLAYFDFNEGSGRTTEDSGPVRFEAGLHCGPNGEACGGTKGWWVEGVGRRSLHMGDRHRIHKICPVPALARLDYNNTWWTYPEYERRGDTRPMPSCSTDIQHRHEVLCEMEYTLHVAYQRQAVEGFPQYYLCDGVKWMPVFYDHHLWNNFELPS